MASNGLANTCFNFFSMTAGKPSGPAAELFESSSIAAMMSSSAKTMLCSEFSVSVSSKKDLAS